MSEIQKLRQEVIRLTQENEKLKKRIKELEQLCNHHFDLDSLCRKLDDLEAQDEKEDPPTGFGLGSFNI